MQGGTRAAPPYFNDRNQEEPANYWPSAYGCHYVVTLRDEQGALLDTLGEAVNAMSARWSSHLYTACPCKWAALCLQCCVPSMPCDTLAIHTLAFACKQATQLS